MNSPTLNERFVKYSKQTFVAKGRPASLGPEQTTLYRLLAAACGQHHPAYNASTEWELPQFIGDGFDAFLDCGILDSGFLRLRCRQGGTSNSWLWLRPTPKRRTRRDVLHQIPAPSATKSAGRARQSARAITGATHG